MRQVECFVIFVRELFIRLGVEKQLHVVFAIYLHRVVHNIQQDLYHIQITYDVYLMRFALLNQFFYFVVEPHNWQLIAR